MPALPFFAQQFIGNKHLLAKNICEIPPANVVSYRVLQVNAVIGVEVFMECALHFFGLKVASVYIFVFS